MAKLDDDGNSLSEDNIRSFLRECLGPSSSQELAFLSDCLREGIQCYIQVHNQRRFLRMPLIFTEPSYMEDLRKGQALRSLRRIYWLCRLERLISECLQEVISGEYNADDEHAVRFARILISF